LENLSDLPRKKEEEKRALLLLLTRQLHNFQVGHHKLQSLV